MVTGMCENSVWVYDYVCFDCMSFSIVLMYKNNIECTRVYSNKTRSMENQKIKRSINYNTLRHSEISSCGGSPILKTTLIPYHELSRSHPCLAKNCSSSSRELDLKLTSYFSNFLKISFDILKSL